MGTPTQNPTPCLHHYFCNLEHQYLPLNLSNSLLKAIIIFTSLALHSPTFLLEILFKTFRAGKRNNSPLPSLLGETIHSLLRGIVWNKQIQLAHRLHKLNNSPKTVSFRFVQHQAYDESCETSRGVSIPIVLTHT